MVTRVWFSVLDQLLHGLNEKLIYEFCTAIPYPILGYVEAMCIVLLLRR